MLREVVDITFHLDGEWLIQEDLEAGLAVFYRSTGSSMWPLVQSHDGCTFHPIQAATATATVWTAAYNTLSTIGATSLYPQPCLLFEDPAPTVVGIEGCCSVASRPL